MKRYLIERGITEGRILKEEKSKTSDENLKYTRALLRELDGEQLQDIVAAKPKGPKADGIACRRIDGYNVSIIEKEKTPLFVCATAPTVAPETSTKKINMISISNYELIENPVNYCLNHFIEVSQMRLTAFSDTSFVVLGEAG